jgi:hypothetical protein
MRRKRTRFVQDAKLDPGRYYRNPSDIIRDRRLSNRDRLEIVIAWEFGTRERIAALEATTGTEETLEQLRRLRAELELDAERDTAAD